MLINNLMCCWPRLKLFFRANENNSDKMDQSDGGHDRFSSTHNKSTNPLKDYEKELRRRSKQIDKELKRLNKVFKSTIKLLLLGTGESGKSTILKQMRIIHISKFSVKEKVEKIYDIKSNIRDSMLSILEAMERLCIKLEDESLSDMREYVFENIHLFTLNNVSSQMIDQHGNEKNPKISCYASTNCSLEEQRDLNAKIEKLWDCIERLWRDGGVRKCARRGNDFHLIDSAEYFLNKINTIRQPNYLPDEQDILRCRVLTTSISEAYFSVKNVSFHILDVGGQRDQRRKWIQCFNEVTAIIYVADISSFNMTLREDNKINRLKESLNSFRQIWINRYLYHISIILFLNKYDLFVKKILDENYKLEDYFPEYKSYKTPAHIDRHLSTPNEHPEITRAKMFILEEFIKITNESLSEAMYKVMNHDSSAAASPHTASSSASAASSDQDLAESTRKKQKSNSESHVIVSNSNNSSSFNAHQLNDKVKLKERSKSSSIVDSKWQRQMRQSYRDAQDAAGNGKFCIPYFTCAVDTENIKRVFKACSHILKKEYLEKSGLL